MGLKCRGNAEKRESLTEELESGRRSFERRDDEGREIIMLVAVDETGGFRRSDGLKARIPALMPPLECTYRSSALR